MSTIDEIREILVDEDDLGFRMPTKPSVMRALADDDLLLLYRKLSYANSHPYSSMLEMEMNGRLMAELRRLSNETHRNNKQTGRLNIVLALLAVGQVIAGIAAIFF